MLPVMKRTSKRAKPRRPGTDPCEQKPWLFPLQQVSYYKTEGKISPITVALYWHQEHIIQCFPPLVQFATASMLPNAIIVVLISLNKRIPKTCRNKFFMLSMARTIKSCPFLFWPECEWLHWLVVWEPDGKVLYERERTLTPAIMTHHHHLLESGGKSSLCF